MQSVHLFVKGHAGGALGTWARVLALADTDYHKSASGTRPKATANSMEIEACIHGFQALNQYCHVTVFSNSQYLIGGLNLLVTGEYYDTNIFQWQRLLPLIEDFELKCEHIPKFSNSGYMRLADSIALNLLAPNVRQEAR